MPIAPRAYWDLLERNTPPIKRRAAHAKARTGCLTCKKRKVKCDEAKPRCARCIKSGHECAGYEELSALRRRRGIDYHHHYQHHQQQQQQHYHVTTGTGTGFDSSPEADVITTTTITATTNTTTTTTAKAHPRTLRPKPLILPPRRPCSNPGPKVNLFRASLTPAYLDAQDTLYFERFQCQMLADLGAWCGAEYWRHTILREVLLDETVRHAAFAAAAMMMDIEQQQHQYEQARLLRRLSQDISNSKRGFSSSQALTGESVTGTDELTTGPQLEAEEVSRKEKEDDILHIEPLSGARTHGMAALRHYTTAIHLCRDTLGSLGVTASTARSSLTAGFLFAVFELVQGNVREADRLLSSGASLLSDALSRTSADGGPPAVVPDDTLREIQLAFDRMRVAWDLCPYFGVVAAAAAAAATGNDKIGGGGGEGAQQAGDLTNSPTALAPAPIRHFEIPSLDAPVRTKQVFWNAFSSEFGQFMVSVQRRIATRRSNSTNTTTNSDLNLNLDLNLDLAPFLPQRTAYLDQLRHWLPVLEGLCAQDPDSIVLCTTRAYAQIAIIFLNCFLDASELAYDAYLPTFKDIVTTYQRILSTPSSSSSSSASSSYFSSSSSSSRSPKPSYLRLTLDVDLFHIITFTVGKCRDRKTRRLALRVFADMTRRQALWSNPAMLAALRALVDVEEDRRRCYADNNNDDDDGGGFIPPEARYSYLGSEWDFRKRRMMAVFAPVLPPTSTPPIAGCGNAAVDANDDENDKSAMLRIPIDY